MLWEKSCHTYKLFLSAKAAMVLRSQHKNRQIDGANYSTQLPFSVNTNVVPKLFTYLPTVKITRGEQENVFFCQFTTLLKILGEFVHVVK